jgi:hypothetical protein
MDQNEVRQAVPLWTKDITKEELKAYNRAAKIRQREREKAAKDAIHKANLANLEAENHRKNFATEEELEARENKREQHRRALKGWHLLGQVSPNINAETVEDALQVCREFARALGSPDIQIGETPYEFEKRIYQDWVSYPKFHGPDGFRFESIRGAAPFLIRATGELVPGLGHDYWTDFRGGWKGWVEMSPYLSLPDAKVPTAEIPAR